jgi:adenylyl-sulfate kinase
MNAHGAASRSPAAAGWTAAVPGVVVWLTGLPCSGKSTLAAGLADRLAARAVPVCVVDGDELRRGLCSDLGFTREDRRENLRRAAEIARLLATSGVVAVVALISPYREDRARARALAPPGSFLEVFVDCPVSVCRERDPKGHYRRADRSEIPEFTGVTAPYEPPAEPELRLPTHELSVEACLERLVLLVESARGAARWPAGAP